MAKDVYGPDVYNEREVWDMIETGEVYMFACDESCILAQPVHFPRRKTLNLWCSMGKGKHIWKVAYPSIAEWAKKEGFFAVTGSGSPGWVRALRHISDVRAAYTVFVKEL